MAKKFFIEPKRVGGVPVSQDIKKLYLGWLETMQEHYNELGISAKAVPNWSRDIPIIQRVYAVCNGDKEAVDMLLREFWTNERYTKYDPTIFLFGNVAENILLDLARKRREGAD